MIKKKTHKIKRKWDVWQRS